MFVFIKSANEEVTEETCPMLLSDIRLDNVDFIAGYYVFTICNLHKEGTAICSREFENQQDAEMALVNCVNLINAIKMAYERYIHGASVNVQFFELKVNKEGKPEYVWHKISEADLTQPITIEI